MSFGVGLAPVFCCHAEISAYLIREMPKPTSLVASSSQNQRQSLYPDGGMTG